MTRKKFMDRLANALRARLGPDSVAAVLADFNDHFDEALRAGHSEAEVCALLGDPKEIAAEYAGQPGPPTPAPADLADHPQPGPSHQSRPGQPGVDIDLSWVNLVCRPTSDEQFHVEVWRNDRLVEDPTIDVVASADRLQVTQRPDSAVVRRLFYALASITVVVQIPRWFDADIAVRLGAGNATLTEVVTGGDLRCTVGAGNADLRQVGAHTLQVSSRAGNIRLQDCAGQLTAECGSGNLRITGHEGTLARATSGAGNVRVGAGRVSQPCLVITRAGNVEFEADQLEAELRLECGAGNVTFTVRDLRANLTAASGAGSIRGALPGDTQAVFRVRSMVAHNWFRDAPGPGVPVVTLTSQVGSVKVNPL